MGQGYLDTARESAGRPGLFVLTVRLAAATQAAGSGADGGGLMAVDLSMPILVVDDYSTMIRIIRNLLRQLGFEDIDDASDGSSALAKMHDKHYGLVISDWNMEPMTGYELLKQVRSDPQLSTTPFIMVTAESKTENVIAAKQAGVNNYIVKPFNADTLKYKIEAVFGPRARLDRFARAASLPHQPPRHGLRHHAGVAEHLGQRRRIGIVAVAQLLGVDAGGDEQAIDAEIGRAFQIGAHRIADRQHAAERGRAAAQRRDPLERQVVDRPVRLAGVEHLAAERARRDRRSRPRNRPACRRARPPGPGLPHSMNRLRARSSPSSSR